MKNPIKQLNQWFNSKTIPLKSPPFVRRYLLAANQMFLSLVGLLLCLIPSAIFIGLVDTQIAIQRLSLGAIILMLYPILLLLKKRLLARFTLSLLLPIVVFWAPLLSGVFSDEFYFKGGYQPLIALLITLWVLHPTKDKFFFWGSIALQVPFTGLTPFLGEYFKPDSLPPGIQENLLTFTLVPFIFYLVALKVGHYIMVSREEALTSLQKINDEMLRRILENEDLQNRQAKDLTERDKKIEIILYKNSHIFRAPIANIKGLFQLLENEVTQGKSVVSEEVFHHLKLSVDNLDQAVLNLNNELEK